MRSDVAADVADVARRSRLQRRAKNERSAKFFTKVFARLAVPLVLINESTQAAQNVW
jgi:hypothetical protein